MPPATARRKRWQRRWRRRSRKRPGSRAASPAEVQSLAAYEAVVLGAPLFMFRWHKEALRFLSRHRKALPERPVAVFALGPTHEPHDEQEWQDSRSQLDKDWPGTHGSSRWRCRCSAAGTTQRSCASRSTCWRVMCQPATCGTGRRSGLGCGIEAAPGTRTASKPGVRMAPT